MVVWDYFGSEDGDLGLQQIDWQAERFDTVVRVVSLQKPAMW